MKLLQIMRPQHWAKNAFVFAGLIFGQKITDPLAVGRAVGAFFCFCLAASAIYIFNDIIDRKADCLHPEKRKRPIAAGNVGIGSAAVVSALCATAAIVGSFALARNFAIVILAYIALMILYSLLFKRMMIMDCLVISIGFCLRAIAGAIVVGVFISPWLIICTFALCLFWRSASAGAKYFCFVKTANLSARRWPAIRPSCSLTCLMLPAAWRWYVFCYMRWMAGH